jgi:hypothetical protein
MTKPNIQIDDEVREMTDEEYAELIASGWKETTACSDRTRVNCERIKNKAPGAVETTVQVGGGRCG